MTNSIPITTLEKFTTFGDLLRYLRRRVGITQVELSIAVGYSISQISRLEQNLRLPDLPTIEARFISPLCLEDEPKAVARLLELAAAVRREDAPALGLCPYKGLDYFDEADADLFVGREALTEKLAERVLALVYGTHADHDRFFAIVGASGSGKSSLVRAGLVPALRWDKRSANWLIHVLTPTAHPLESLATTLARENGSLAATAALMDDLARDQRTLSLYIKRELKTNGGIYFLLVVDQFEELFALCRLEEERSAFIGNLITAASDSTSGAVVVITLRADFYAHCASYLQLREALATHQEYIGTMSDEEMQRAIEEPAHRGRWEFEPGLMDLILHDVGHEPGALPLLSHALLETWQRRHARTLTLSGYVSAGGVRGAIAETAETVFTDQFTHEQQAIARRIFLRLTELGDETATGDTRRRATFKELILKPAETDATQAVLKALADARLITTSEDSVQVAHEALIREWPTLRGWLEDNREGLRLHRQLTEAAQEWLSAEREPDILFRGARLAQAHEWADTHADDMNSLEREFLQASVEFNEREAAAREAARQRELDAAQKLADTERQRAEEGVKSAHRLKRRAILTTGFGVLTLILALLSFFAWQRSTSQAAINLSLSLAGAAQLANQGGHGDLALTLAMESVKGNQSPAQALQALRTVALGTGTRAVLNGHSHSVEAVAFSPDTKIAFSGSCAQMDAEGTCRAGELILWDMDALKEFLRWSGHSSWVTAVAVSQDGQTLISGAEDGSLILWNRNGEQIGQLVGHSGSITGLAVVRATGSLLSGSADGSLILWDLKTRDRLINFDPVSSPITAIAVAADASKAVSGHEDGSLILWDLASPHYIFLKPQEARINAVALNSDGSRIFLSLGGTGDLFIRMLDSENGAQLNEHFISCATENFALSPNGSYALLSCQHLIIQWDIQNWRQTGSFWGHELYVNAITISQDGRLALSGARDGTVRVWNLGDQFDFQIITIPADGPISIDISSDGKYLLLDDASKNGSTQPALWDILQSKVVRTYSGFNGGAGPGSVAISPDDQYVAIAGIVKDTPIVMVWELESGDLQCRITAYDAMGRSVAFSPDSQYLLAGSQDPIAQTGQLILWNIQTCQSVRQFDTHEDVAGIAFSADGTRAITGAGYYGRAILWDVGTGKEIKRFTYPFKGGPALGVDFGPGESSIIGSGDADLYLWDAESGEIIRRYAGLSPWPWTLDLSSDYKYVISGGQDGNLILWDFATGDELHRLNVSQPIFSAVISPDGKTAYAVAQEGRLVEWHLAEKSLPELLDWIKSNRYVRELTCEERQQYHVDPQCSP
jgi:WD40 repeat protein